MNKKLLKFQYTQIVVLLAVIVLGVISATSLAQAASGSYNNGQWKMRYDTTSSKYGCSAAPGGKVTGKHINFEIWDRKGNKLNNLHVWLGYLPTIYVSDGAFCAKMDKTTFKNLMKNIENFLKLRMSSTSIKSLISSIESLRFVTTFVIILPNCNNPPSWDIYSRLLCSGMSGTYSA